MDMILDFLGGFVDADTMIKLGAGYAVLQAVANLLTLVLPKHTIAFKLAKQLIAGTSRQP